MAARLVASREEGEAAAPATQVGNLCHQERLAEGSRQECRSHETARAGGHGNARPTERQTAGGGVAAGMPLPRNGKGRRAWECPPYRTANGWRRARGRNAAPTKRQGPAGMGMPALQNGKRPAEGSRQECRSHETATAGGPCSGHQLFAAVSSRAFTLAVRSAHSWSRSATNGRSSPASRSSSRSIFMNAPAPALSPST